MHLLPIFWRQKFSKPNVIREKLLNLLSYKKRTLKMLMKLTPGENKKPRKKFFPLNYLINQYQIKNIA
jgi:hypothetical protein